MNEALLEVLSQYEYDIPNSTKAELLDTKKSVYTKEGLLISLISSRVKEYRKEYFTEIQFRKAIFPLSEIVVFEDKYEWINEASEKYSEIALDYTKVDYIYLNDNRLDGDVVFKGRRISISTDQEVGFESFSNESSVEVVINDCFYNITRFEIKKGVLFLWTR